MKCETNPELAMMPDTGEDVNHGGGRQYGYREGAVFSMADLDVNSAARMPSKQSNARKRRAVQFAVLCSCLILEGWSDGSVGPLLPRIQDHYGVRMTRL